MCWQKCVANKYFRVVTKITLKHIESCTRRDSGVLDSATEYHDDDDEECDDSSSTLSSLSDSVDDVSDVEVGDIDSLGATGLAELLSCLPASVTTPRIPPPTEKASYELAMRLNSVFKVLA